jgi:hypothetical protein
MLYVGLGDGGGAGDPLGNARDPGVLLGKLLRLDVDAAEPYAVPPGNPYAGQPGRRGEIWASGLRNPWRFAFDAAAGRLYVADVGQGRLEEVNVVPIAAAGVDYGWSRMEGTSCFAAPACDRAGLQLPVLEYGHEGGACSVTGGFVYRGAEAALAALRGHYLYADYCAGWVRSVRVLADGGLAEQTTWPLGDVGNVLSFGEDAAGRLYVLSGNGTVYVLEAAGG